LLPLNFFNISYCHISPLPPTHTKTMFHPPPVIFFFSSSTHFSFSFFFRQTVRIICPSQYTFEPITSSYHSDCTWLDYVSNNNIPMRAVLAWRGVFKYVCACLCHSHTPYRSFTWRLFPSQTCATNTLHSKPFAGSTHDGAKYTNIGVFGLVTFLFSLSLILVVLIPLFEPHVQSVSDRASCFVFFFSSFPQVASRCGHALAPAHPRGTGRSTAYRRGSQKTTHGYAPTEREIYAICTFSVLKKKKLIVRTIPDRSKHLAVQAPITEDRCIGSHFNTLD
jgi:hypothetical protein